MSLPHSPPRRILPSPENALVVALGSNLGDSATQLRAAMSRLEAMAGAPGWRSSLWSTPPVDCPPGSPEFVNAALVLALPQDWTPEGWLAATQALECEFGRRPKLVLNESRPLDVDLITWGREIRNTPELTLPHPRGHERRFVLAPLAEMLPTWTWPGQNRTVAELLSACPPDDRLRRLELDSTAP